MGILSTISNYWALWDQSFPPKATWATEDMPDLSGKVMLVTGANAGIGYETTKALLAKNAKVYMACRNREKAREAIERLKKETEREAVFLEMDLSSLRSVKRAAEEFASKEDRLDVLYNNGGVMFSPDDKFTAEGYCYQFGTNCLAHFYLTKLLLPLLLKASNIPGGKARVISVSSTAHMFGTLDFDALRDGDARRKMTVSGSTELLYYQSKLGNVIFAQELARRYGDEGIVSIALNPGNIKTQIINDAPGFMKHVLNWQCFYTPAEGALTQLYAGTAPEAADMNGKYLIPWARLGEMTEDARSPELGRRLWEWCEAQLQNI